MAREREAPPPEESAPRVLVTYAGVHGSTRSIAQRVAARLAEGPLHADCRDVEEVSGPLDHDAFVIGSAVHDMHWLPAALAFTREHTDTLRHRPVWIFSVGMPAALRGPWRAMAARKEEDAVAKDIAEALRPRGRILFSGVIRPEHLSASGRMKMKTIGLRYGDYRDWDAVDAWARGIRNELLGTNSHV